jgi:acetoin utilization deacetylase AcuC-like enzyme
MEVARTPTAQTPKLPIMLIYYNASHALHCGRQEMYRGRLVPSHEVPARADFVRDELRRRRFGTWHDAAPADLDVVRRIHDARYVDFLATAWARWTSLDPANADVDILPSVWPNAALRRDVTPDNFAAQVGLYAFDAGTPIGAGTWSAALCGAGGAIAAARAVLVGAPAAMVLTRPPGHHAGADFYGGYCFLNNAALAAQTLVDGGLQRVAVLDVDYHHGNGTQSLFYERADVFTASIHGDPRTEYPFYLGHADERGRGEGEGCNLNLALPAGTGFRAWREALARALSAVSAHRPQALVVPLGVDTFEGDPISGFTFKSADYRELGRLLAEPGLPTVFTLEGGYAVAEVGVNVANVLEGFEHAHAPAHPPA